MARPVDSAFPRFCLPQSQFLFDFPLNFPAASAGLVQPGCTTEMLRIPFSLPGDFAKGFVCL